MTTVLICIGSNIGQRKKNCQRAIALLKDKVTILKTSSFYETEPWHNTKGACFVNCITEIVTSLDPRRLLDILKWIEQKMGRVDAGKWGPRIIDLDILFYGDEIIEENDITIPHPFLDKRAFVLVPLSEIAPDILHPVINKTATEMLSELKDTGSVKKLNDTHED
jgi:2-amino-4-hydroxy-6-hydroxymethyldihydropteridine diphosphokinase